MKPTLLVFIAMIAGVLMASTFWMSCKSGTSSDFFYYSWRAEDFNIAGMHYKLFNSTQGNLFVINVTNDSLANLKLLKQ